MCPSDCRRPCNSVTDCVSLSKFSHKPMFACAFWWQLVQPTSAALHGSGPSAYKAAGLRPSSSPVGLSSPQGQMGTGASEAAAATEQKHHGVSDRLASSLAQALGDPKIVQSALPAALEAWQPSRSWKYTIPIRACASSLPQCTKLYVLGLPSTMCSLGVDERGHPGPNSCQLQKPLPRMVLLAGVRP